MPAKKPVMALERVTPAQARAWLELNLENRKLQAAPMRRFARDMTEGRWLDAHPAPFVLIDREDGSEQLIDGQHRAAACVESGHTFTAWVYRHAPPASRQVLDTGTKRTLGDVLKLRGDTDVALLAGTLTAMHRWKPDGRLVTGGLGVPSVTEALEILEAHPDVYAALPDGRRLNTRLGVSPSFAAAFAQRTRAMWPDRVDEFVHLAATGDGIGIGHPVYALRRWADNAYRGRNWVPATQGLAMLVKAFNGWNLRVSIQLLTYRRTERFPELLTPDQVADRRAAGAEIA